MTSTVFIDGQEGTTGLEIHERLQARSDLRLIEIDPALRKDTAAKRELMRQADLVVLCLPDAAAVEAVGLAGSETRMLDASTAHRVHPEWVYGLPELSGEQRAKVRSARLVSNPGCFPTGFLLLVRPLVEAGVLAADYPLSVHAQSGYSGAGKKAIGAYEARAAQIPERAWAARPYGLSLQHKHVPEMQRYALLAHAPIFAPSICDYYRGMLVSVPLHVRALARRVSPAEVQQLLAERYAGEAFVRVMPLDASTELDEGRLNATACNGTNRVELFVFGHGEQLLLTARLDNLGKGAAGAAVQNLNLMLGADEATGLGAMQTQQ